MDTPYTSLAHAHRGIICVFACLCTFCNYPFPGHNLNLEQFHIAAPNEVAMACRDGRGSMAVHKLTIDFMPCCCLDGSMCGL